MRVWTGSPTLSLGSKWNFEIYVLMLGKGDLFANFLQIGIVHKLFEECTEAKVDGFIVY